MSSHSVAPGTQTWCQLGSGGKARVDRNMINKANKVSGEVLASSSADCNVAGASIGWISPKIELSNRFRWRLALNRAVGCSGFGGSEGVRGVLFAAVLACACRVLLAAQVAP